MPCFSVIIPVYNVAPYLRRCLDSVLAQSFTDWEAICVNDGSTDDSAAILDEYAAKDNRIKVIHQENNGVNYARQTALEKSAGDWIASIDSDDWVGPDFLKNFYEALSDGICDMLWTDIIRHVDGRAEREPQAVNPDSAALQRAMIAVQCWGGNVNKCYSRKFIVEHKISFPVEQRVHVCEDLCFNVVLLSYKPRLKYLPVADYHYMVRNGSAIRSILTSEKVKSTQYIDRIMFEHVLFEDIEELRLHRRMALKSYAYCSTGISNKEFYALYPEIKSLKGFSSWPRQRILFWLAAHGLRTQVLWFFRFVRWLRGMFKSKSC